MGTPILLRRGGPPAPHSSMRLVAWMLLTCTAAMAQDQSPRQRPPQPRKADQPEVRVLQLPNGSTIRYEVAPGESAAPGGELSVMHFETPPAEPARAKRTADVEEEQASSPRPAPRKARRRTACDEIRARLSARLLELRGLSVDPELAAFIQHNLYFAGGPARPILIAPDPLFLDAIRSDLAARTLVQEWAQCERQ
jgi:hypothetical protein